MPHLMQNAYKHTPPKPMACARIVIAFAPVAWVWAVALRGIVFLRSLM